ncbi:unnamed protein product [Bathycoccus prasinos]
MLYSGLIRKLLRCRDDIPLYGGREKKYFVFSFCVASWRRLWKNPGFGNSEVFRKEYVIIDVPECTLEIICDKAERKP